MAFTSSISLAAMTIRGPFPEPRTEHQRPGWVEYVVHGPVRAYLYTTLRFDDELVQDSLARYLARADVPRPTG